MISDKADLDKVIFDFADTLKDVEQDPNSTDRDILNTFLQAVGQLCELSPDIDECIYDDYIEELYLIFQAFVDQANTKMVVLLNTIFGTP